MPQKTAFHPRLEPLNQTGIWKNWSGYLVAPRYQYSIVDEYYAIRNSVALLDTSPLFKYRIAGNDASALLERVCARDIRRCHGGQAQYTAWCDPNGFVLQDGVVLNLDDTDAGNCEYLMTAAEPSLYYLRKTATQAGLADLTIEDVSTKFGILALQGPHAFNVISQLTDDVGQLNYFEVVKTKIEGRPVVVSRTGYTGDLGYEIWIGAEDALVVWDALMAAGAGFNITPIGTTALKMSRVEAGLLLMDVDFHSARHAWVDAQRETPIELGWSWMFKNLANDDRDFIGRAAIEKERAERTCRWTTVGLNIDWHDYERVHHAAGIEPPKHELYRESTMSIYRRGETEWDYAGYASSFLFSSLLKRPIAIAKLPLDLAKPGSEVDLEVTVIKRPVNVLARVVRMPFFNPPRKTSPMNGSVLSESDSQFESGVV